MRLTLTLCLILPATGAQAHIGHIIGAGGHDHLAIGVAIGVIGLAGLLGALKGRGKKDADAPDEDEGEPA